MVKFFKILTMVTIVFIHQQVFAQCDAPTNLTVTYDNVLNTSIFSWDPVSTASEYRFQLKFEWDAWAEVDEILSNSTYSITGLATSFPFEWRVSSICNTVESAFGPTQSYTVPCPLPNGLNATNITTSSATLNWAYFPGTNFSFSLGYRIANSNASWTTLGTTSAFTYNISGLQSNTTYEWCVNTNCSFFNSNPATGIFTTAISCGAPTNLTVTYDNVLNKSTFSWDPVSTATQYRFQLKFPWGTWTNTSSAVQNIGPDNTYSYTGLATSFPFQWRVSSICNTVESTFSPTQSYTVPCPLPNGLNVTNITTSSATLNWAYFPGVNFTFSCSYRIANSNAAWTPVGTTSAFTLNVSALQPNTTYEWCVNTNCSYFNSNPAISQFTTAVGCGLPFNLTNTNTTNTQNRVNWTSINGATSYTVQYKANSATNWTTVNTNTNSRNLTGLTPETLYDWKVRVNCPSGSGDYTAPMQFHTYSTYCYSYGLNNSEWIDLFSLGMISRISGKDVSGYFRSSQSTDLLIGSSTNAGQLSCGFPPGIVNLQKFVIYIDFNRNGNFGDAGEQVLAPLSTTGSGIFNFNIAIPNNVTPGPTKLRLILRQGTGSLAPCGGNVRGEVEDYVVNLTTALTGQGGDGLSAEKAELESEIEVEDRNATHVLENVLVSPNPGNGLYYVQLGELHDIAYKVVNALSGVIVTGNISETSGFDLDLSQQPSGIYYLLIGNEMGRQKLVPLVKL